MAKLLDIWWLRSCEDCIGHWTVLGLDVKILHEYSDDNGRILALKCKIQDHSFLLVNFYNENQQNEQLEALENLNRMLLNIDLESESKIIPGGDFNLIFDIKLEFDGGKSTLKYSSISKVELRDWS